MEQLDGYLHEKILSHLNVRDVVRAGGTNRALREASHTELHNVVNNPHVMRVAERYKSKLRAPRVVDPADPGSAPYSIRTAMADVLPERNQYGEPTQFRGDGSRTFAGRQLKHAVDHTLTDRLGRDIDRGRN